MGVALAPPEAQRPCCKASAPGRVCSLPGTLLCRQCGRLAPGFLGLWALAVEGTGSLASPPTPTGTQMLRHAWQLLLKMSPAMRERTRLSNTAGCPGLQPDSLPHGTARGLGCILEASGGVTSLHFGVSTQEGFTQGPVDSCGELAGGRGVWEKEKPEP